MGWSLPRPSATPSATSASAGCPICLTNLRARIPSPFTRQAGGRSRYTYKLLTAWSSAKRRHAGLSVSGASWNTCASCAASAASAEAGSRSRAARSTGGRKANASEQVRTAASMSPWWRRGALQLAVAVGRQQLRRCSAGAAGPHAEEDKPQHGCVRLFTKPALAVALLLLPPGEGLRSRCVMLLAFLPGSSAGPHGRMAAFKI